jgi:two-component system nitrate/nitrite response regulator NarL
LTRLLIYDDQPVFVEALALLVKSNFHDFEVFGVATSEETLVAIETWNPDVLLIDPFRSGVDGIETICLMKRQSPTLKVVVLTESKEEQDLLDAIRAGVVGYTTKDRNVEHIEQVLKSVLDGNLSIPIEITHVLLSGVDTPREKDLTDEERGILRQIGERRSDSEMAAAFHLSLRTVRRRIASLYKKIDVRDRVSAALYANRRGWKRKSDRGSR